MKPLHLPWSPATVPHCVLDIIRECNITCAACYNKDEPWRKAVGEIRDDLDFALANRRLHTVAIAGGEPTLHPDLPEIIQLVRSRGLYAVLLTNGVNLNRESVEVYKKSGLNFAMLHIDRGQRRPDLPCRPSLKDITRLCEEKAALLCRHGIDVGLVTTVYKEGVRDVGRVASFILESPYVHFLLATCHWNSECFFGITGTLDNGFFMHKGHENIKGGGIELDEIDGVFQRLGMRPFAYVGSSASKKEKRWLCYTSAVCRNRANHLYHCSLRSALSDRFLIRLVYLLTGRFIYYVKRNATRFKIQIILNAITGGLFFENMKILFQSFLSGADIYEKRFVIQYGPTVDKDGRLIHCENCPDATIISNQFVPLCISDSVNHR